MARSRPSTSTRRSPRAPRRLLDDAGYAQVTAVCADAEHGLPGHAPYDRILVTVGAWDIPPEWTNQLVAGGRLVVPLRILGGLTRSVALERDGDRWVSIDHQLCGFVPMRGGGAHDERVVGLGEDVRLRLGNGPCDLDPVSLRTALEEPPVQRWTGVEFVDNEPFDGLHLWLAATIPGFARLAADQAAVDNGVVDRLARWNTPAAVDGDSIAYLAPLRPNTENTRHEFGVRGHGPAAHCLAEDCADLVRTWDQHYRDQQARIDVYPAGADVPQHPVGRIIDKHHTRVAVHWPHPCS